MTGNGSSQLQIHRLYAAVSVLYIIKSKGAQRIFVQGASKNKNAIRFASMLSSLNTFIINELEIDTGPSFSISDNSTKLFITDQTKDNFGKSKSLEAVFDKLNYEEAILFSRGFPPEKNWFHEYNFFRGSSNCILA